MSYNPCDGCRLLSGSYYTHTVGSHTYGSNTIAADVFGNKNAGTEAKYFYAGYVLLRHSLKKEGYGICKKKQFMPSCFK